ncbi:MAG TPA: right-handed parallel beta-helix repeat-containing protein [Kofleriaceae bacterium]|nr:right-handed parallel beta-helix repeat-containing protein [Kofleriaceae bacterium]
MKLSGILNEQVTITNQDVIFHAEPSAVLTSMSSGPLLRVEGTSQVSIYDLVISGAVGATSGFGIAANSGTATLISLTRVTLSDNQAGGLSAIGGTLSISRSTISGNAGGGVFSMNGAFAIVGNVFFKNGSDTALVGGSQSVLDRLAPVVSSSTASARIGPWLASGQASTVPRARSRRVTTS